MQKIKPYEPIEISLEDETIREFLDAQSKNTKTTYETYMRRLLEFTNNESGSQLLKERKLWERKIFAFREWLKVKGYSPAYQQSASGMLRGFFAYYRKPLVFSRMECKKLRYKTRTTEDYLFLPEDLYKMWLCGSVKARYVVAVGKSIGLRAEDFSKLTYGQFRALDLNGEIPIFLGEIVTSKEGVKAFCFLDKDAVESVKALLEYYPDKKDDEEIWIARSEDLSPLLRRLVDKAKIQHGNKRIRFHCLRKYLCDRLSQYMSDSKWKQCVGKAIGESSYISSLSLREDYARAMPSLALQGNGVKEKVKSLEEQVKDKDARIRELEQKLATYESDKNRLEKMLDNQSFDILEIQDKLGIKHKEMRDTT
jgi:integrase